MKYEIKLSTLRAINFASVSVGIDDVRPTMQSVHVNGDEIVCTNGHYLTMVKHDDENFKAIYDCPFSLRLLKEDLKNLKDFIKLAKKLDGGELIEVVIDMDAGILTFSHKNIGLCLVLQISPYGFPRYQAIIPKNKGKTAIGFNRKYLINLLENMDCTNVRFDIYGDLSPVKITSTHEEEDENKLSLISPVKL